MNTELLVILTANAAVFCIRGYAPRGTGAWAPAGADAMASRAAAAQQPDVAAFLDSMPGFEAPPRAAAPARRAASTQQPRKPPRADAAVPQPEPEPEPARAAAVRAPAPADTKPRPSATHRYDVKSIDLDGSGRLVAIHEAARSNAGGVGGELWDGAILLARWLQLQLASSARSSAAAVLELGAGTGLVGISAAALCGARVVLTDRGEVFEVTQLNAAENRQAVEAAQGIVECTELDWLVAAGEAEAPDRLPDERDHQQSAVPVRLPEPPRLPRGGGGAEAPGWDFVVGSDILYDARLYKVLARLVNAAIRTGVTEASAGEGGGAAVPGGGGGSRTVCALSYSVSPHSVTQFFKLCEGHGDHSYVYAPPC